eukprot:GILJ01004927.1.p1 GENE.GILJ01004927.1~~GILJ01004927.1.p1  ORF type:complete len:489 (-),score=73.64 GILJ01004927.1:113-1579(-)
MPAPPRNKQKAHHRRTPDKSKDAAFAHEETEARKANKTKGKPTAQNENPGNVDAQYVKILPWDVAEGREEVLRLWKGMTKDEKKEILYVDAEDVMDVLVRSNLVFAEEDGGMKKINDILDDPQYMGYTRQIFIDAMHHEKGTLQNVDEPLRFALLKVFERHLVRKYNESNVSRRVFYFVFYLLWCSVSSSYWISFLLIILWIAFAMAENRYIKWIRSSYLLLFWDLCPCCVERKANALLAGILCLDVANRVNITWHPELFLVIPLVFGEIEKRISSRIDMNALHKIRTVTTVLGQIVLIVISWSVGYITLVMFGWIFFSSWVKVLGAVSLLVLVMAYGYVKRIVIWIRSSESIHMISFIMMASLFSWSLVDGSYKWATIEFFGLIVLLPNEVFARLSPWYPLLQRLLAILIAYTLVAFAHLSIWWNLLNLSPKLGMKYLWEVSVVTLKGLYNLLRRKRSADEQNSETKSSTPRTDFNSGATGSDFSMD